MTRTILPALAAVLAAAALAPGQPPAPAPPPAPTIPADGTEVFRWLLHKRGVKPLTRETFLARYRDRKIPNVIVVVIGQPHLGHFGGDLPAQWGATAVRNGGAALVAGDQFYRFESPFTGNHTIVNERLVNPRPENTYAGHEDCLFATPRGPPIPGDGPEWRLFAGLKRVATNRPGCIPFPAPHGEFRSRLAGFPADTRLESDPAVRIKVADPLYTLAVGGSGPHPVTLRPYRFLAVADPDVFTNEMMIPLPGEEPADNLVFAQRVVSFLVEEGGTDRRKECLFYQNGKLIDRFDTLGPFLQPPTPIPGPPPFGQLQEKLVDAGNEVVDKLQENDALTRLVLSGSEERRRAVVRVVAEVLTALAAVWAVFVVGRRVWGARHPTDLPPPPPAGRPVTRDGERPAGVFDRRQKELLRRDDLAEPVRAAVRELFREAGAPADAGPKLPQVRVDDEVRRPDTLVAALRDLWAVGYGRPKRLTARRWAELEPLFVRARKAHADGKWAFVWHEPA